MVCSLDQAFGGIEDIKIKKKKQKKNKQGQEIVYPQEIRAIDRHFDEEASGILPFDGSEFIYPGDYYPVSRPQNLQEYNSYPNKSKSLGAQEPLNESELLTVQNYPQPKAQPQNVELEPRQFKKMKQYRDNMKMITDEEYKEYKEFQKKRNQEMNTRNLNGMETFGNMSDDFNDVLLFGLMGIFFLLIIDYVYKLGKKSY
jgi:hypothetical protein